MGLILICVALVFIATLLLPSTSLNRFSKKERLKGLGMNILCSVVLGILLGVSLSLAINDILLDKDNPPKLEAFIVHTYELEEFRPGIYVTIEIPEDIPKLVVRTETEDRYINWKGTSVEFNSETAYMEKYIYDWKNKTLKFLLLDPMIIKYKIYTPQENLDDIRYLIVDKD